GGLLSGWISAYFCFGLVAVGLLGAAFLTWRIQKPTQQGFSSQSAPAFDAIREAGGYLKRKPRMLALVTVKSAVGLGNGVLAAFPLLAAAFGVGAQGLGVMFAARGLGALVGPLVFRRLLNRSEWLLPGLAISMSAYGIAYLGVATT